MENRDEMGKIPVPDDARLWSKRRKWSSGEYPGDFRPTGITRKNKKSPPGTVDIRDSPSEEELQNIGRQILDAPEQCGYGGEDSVDIGMAFGGNSHWHMANKGTYVSHGTLICDRIAELPVEYRIDATHHLVCHGANAAKRIHV